MGWFTLRLHVFLALFIVAGAAFVGPAGIHASAYPDVTLLGYTFTFDGKTYDAVRDESTWHYTVAGPMVSGPAYKDLSHWILALCTPHEVAGGSGNKWERRTKPDPHHGIIGIKWDETVSKTGSGSFFFVLKGDWDVDLNVAVGVKAGPDTAAGILPGPGCQRSACHIDYDIMHRTDLRFLSPGEYAAVIAHIDVWGTSPVRLRFSEFGHAEYLNPWASSPDIRFQYSIGRTIDDADAFGWYSAFQFNGKEVVIPKTHVGQGARVNVWGRVLVTADHLSSEYGAGGRVTVELLCD